MEQDWREKMCALIDYAYSRLLSTRHEILEPWKNAYEGLQRFQDCPDDPMKHVYPAMVEMAMEGKALDTNDIVDQFDSCILAWVDSQLQPATLQDDPQNSVEPPEVDD